MPPLSSLADSVRGQYYAANRLALEGQARAATIRRLAVSLDQQRRQLDSRLSAALEVMTLAADGELAADNAETTTSPRTQNHVQGISVRCLTAEYQLRSRNYTMRDKDIKDAQALRARFATKPP